ncbi:Hypothetical predicted protein [Mytilus galloprovincialis]|uniref:Endonuclease n=1 Tax=Mytilus galloprovincialis TaxID=29158 RepID=A0A8B6BTV2_MYTGA|nr:Hypothetical predicted protein [Mytilus galloprovincialis]
MEKRQQSIPKKEIECLKGKFVTSEKNSSEKHLTTEGLGPSSSDVKIISKKSDQCSKNEHIEKPVLSRVDAVNQYRDDIIKKTSALTSGILPEKHFEDNESSDDSVDGGNNVCIDRVESAVIQTSVRINDYELKAVIDTGAEVTVLSEKVYRNLAKEYHLELKTATRGLLVAEEGKKMSATGITEIEMSLGPLRFTWPVYVAPLNDDLLLGCDIIDEMDITVNTKRGIQIKDIWYPCEVKRRENKVLRIVLNKSISIKSQSEMIIQILVPDTEIFKSNFALFEPVIYDNRKILAGKGLVSTQIPFIPVRFINLENSPLKIKEGTLIGTLETVDEVTDFVDVTDVQMTKIPKICRLHDPVKTHDTSENVFTSSRENKVDEFCSEVPEYLKELFQNSCKNIKSNTAKKTLADVLVKHKDAFAKSKTELGSCSVLKHRIDTAHAAPVRQPLRRTPQAFEKEEEKYLRDQIETGVVRPSSSAWSSPVVLVHKSDDWTEFHDKVDNIKDIGRTNESIRAVTRSSTKQARKPANWLQKYTASEMKELQRKDNDVGPLFTWKESKEPTTREQVARFSPATRKYWLNWNNIISMDNVLYQRLVPNNPTDVPKMQLLVPEILRSEILTLCHDSIFSAHFGIKKTTMKIKEHFHWYRMREDIKQHIRQCPSCCKLRKTINNNHAALQNYHVGYPMDRVALDVMGPFPKSKNGNRFILVIGDHFTRWMEAYPLPNQYSHIVAEKLVNEFVSRFGIPLEIHTDQGTNFQSNLFQELCRLLDIHKTKSTPFHPSSNGLIEKFNQTLGKMIKSYVDENKRKWDFYIPILMSAYRSTVHPSTGFSPNKLMLGREVNLPHELLYPLPRHNAQKPVNEYVDDLRVHMEDIYHVARENLKQSGEKQKRDHDTRIIDNK